MEKHKFISIGQVNTMPNWLMKKHHHPFHEMIIITSGKLFVRIMEKDIVAVNGDILFYPQGIAHREKTDPKDPAKITFIVWEGDKSCNDIKVHDSAGRIRILSQWLFEENHSDYFRKNYTENVFLSAILTEFIKLTEYKKENILVQTVRSYVYEHLDKCISLDVLAETVGMSKYHFLREYKKHTGQTPIEDVRRIRLKIAHNMIITSDIPLKAIASSVGMDNICHFSRLFRKFYNMSPGSLRRKTVIYRDKNKK
jgi:AraC-like DNA-binding protein